MNKMKRVFSLVLAFAIVLGTFGSVAPAFAETVDAPVATEELNVVPADVIGTEYEAAVRRLVAFGLVEGYPDGTYQPEKEINRAQFAKLLVYALGLDDAVRAAEGQSTGFKDVKGDYWAAGYINVASGQGLIKGYPDGSFRPAEKVTYAHTLTMLVRALGYQDEFLPGNWPGNYVAKAADVGITRGLRLPAQSTEGSKRGIVAQLINNTLDSKVVEVAKYVGISGIEYAETDETLLKNKLEISKHEDTRIVSDKFIDDGLRKEEVNVRFLEETREPKEVRKAYRENETAKFDSKFDVRSFIGEEVTTYLTDRDVVIYIESENDDTANFDYVEEVDLGKKEVSLVRFDKGYRFADDADVFIFDSGNDKYDELKGEDLKNADFDQMLGKVGKFVVKNNRVVHAVVQDSTEVNPWLVVLKNDNNVLEGVRQTTEDYKLDLTKGRNYDQVFVFDTEGNELAVKDIEKGNLVYAQEQEYDGDDIAVVTVVRDNKVTGEVGTFREDRVEIGGKTYKAIRYKDNGNKFQAYYSVDDLEDIKEWNVSEYENDMDDAYKEEVTAYLDATGKIAFLTTDVDSVSGYKFGVVTRTYADGDRVRIYTTVDGKEGKDTIFKADKEANLLTPRVLKNDGVEYDVKAHNILGQAVKFKLDRDGEISKDEFYVMDNSLVAKMADDFGKDTMRVTIDGKTSSFAVNDNVQIIDAEGLDVKKFSGVNYGDIEVLSDVDVDDFDVIKWENIKEDNKDTDLEFFVFPKKNRTNEVDGMVFVGAKGANTGSDEVAVYVIKRQRRGDDIEVEYVEYGKAKETKVVDNADNLADVKIQKAYVAKHKSNGKIELLDDSKKFDDFTVLRNVEVTQTGSEFKAGGKTYVYRGSPVTYFEDKIKDARVGDRVDLILEDNVRVRVVGIVKESGKATTPGDEKGRVTFVNEQEGLIEVDNKVLKLDDRVRLLSADGVTKAIGPKLVAKELTKGMKVDIKSNKDGVVTEIKLVKDKEDPVDPETPEIKATYAERSALGVARVTITVENANASDVQEVLVNGVKVDIQRKEGKDVTILSAETVNKVEIVIDGKTYTATK